MAVDAARTATPMQTVTASPDRMDQRHARHGAGARPPPAPTPPTRVLRQGLVHLHHRRRVRRPPRHRHRDDRAVADHREPRPATPTIGPGRDVDPPGRHPLRAHARTRRRRRDASLARRRPVRSASPVRPASPVRAATPDRGLRPASPVGRRVREHPAVGDRASTTPVAGRRSCRARCWRGCPTQSVTLGSSSSCTTHPGPADTGPARLTLEDVAFFEGTPLADVITGGVPARGNADHRHELRNADRGVRSSPPTRTATPPVHRSGSVRHDLLELDADADAAAVLADQPDLRRVRLRTNFDAFVDAPVADARLNELNLFATDLGQVSVSDAIDASPAVGSVRIADIPVNDTNPDDGAYGRRDLVVDCSAGFDCSGAATLGDAPDGRRAAPDREAAGRRPSLHRQHGDGGAAIPWRRSCRRCRRRSTSTT